MPFSRSPPHMFSVLTAGQDACSVVKSSPTSLRHGPRRRSHHHPRPRARRRHSGYRSASLGAGGSARPRPHVRRLRRDHRPQSPVTGGEWRSIHAPPRPARPPHSHLGSLHTGIKTIDVLAPLERGGKSGLFGGAGVGKTVLIMELIHNMIGASQRRQRLLRSWRALPRRRGTLSRTPGRRRVWTKPFWSSDR